MHNRARCGHIIIKDIYIAQVHKSQCNALKQLFDMEDVLLSTCPLHGAASSFMNETITVFIHF